MVSCCTDMFPAIFFKLFDYCSAIHVYIYTPLRFKSSFLHESHKNPDVPDGRMGHGKERWSSLRLTHFYRHRKKGY